MKLHRQEFSVRRLNAIVMPGTGGGVLVAVGVAPEGKVAKLAVKQVVPTTPYKGSTAPTPSVAFTVDVFDSLPPEYSFGLSGNSYPTSGQPIDASAITIPANADMYRVLAQKSAVSGAAVVDYATGDDGYSYRNGDTTSSTNAVRLLYVLITPGSAAPGTLWELLLLLDNDIG